MWGALQTRGVTSGGEGIVFAASAYAGAQPTLDTYSAMLKDDGHTWCAYKNPAEYKSDAMGAKPIDSAKVSYQSDGLTEVTYQAEAESGDWIVIDKYKLSKEDVLLRRTNLLAQENLQIIQEATIRAGQASALNVVSVTKLDGKKAKLSTVDYPAVSIETDLLSAPFVQVVAELRLKAVAKLCK